MHSLISEKNLKKMEKDSYPVPLSVSSASMGPEKAAASLDVRFFEM